MTTGHGRGARWITVGAAVVAAMVPSAGGAGAQSAPAQTAATSASSQMASPATARTTNWAAYRKPADAELRRKLTPEQYEITQQAGTERPFDNEYWNNERPGIYVDIVSGEPLFSSLDKFDSHTGWPSFTKPLEPGNMIYENDYQLFAPRIEVKSKYGQSHLGHVFDDGPAPTHK